MLLSATVLGMPAVMDLSKNAEKLTSVHRILSRVRREDGLIKHLSIA